MHCGTNGFSHYCRMPTWVLIFIPLCGAENLHCILSEMKIFIKIVAKRRPNSFLLPTNLRAHCVLQYVALLIIFLLFFH